MSLCSEIGLKVNMEVKEHYNDEFERQAIARAYEDMNKRDGSIWRPIHDNFENPAWKHGDPMSGTLILTDAPQPSSVTTHPLQAQWDAAPTTADKIKILAQILGLKVV